MLRSGSRAWLVSGLNVRESKQLCASASAAKGSALAGVVFPRITAFEETFVSEATCRCLQRTLWS